MATKLTNPTPNAFLDKIAHTITDHNMVQSDDSVLVCVSGGPDSVALVFALQKLSSRFSLNLGIAHLDHCLRPNDSKMDAEFVESLAKQLNMPFYLKTCDVQQYKTEKKLSLEDAARKIRYDFFFHVSKKQGYAKIATAHHAEDNAELILMNMLRGSGKSGISGIPAIRQKKIIRPLIHISKTEIKAFLSDNQLDYVHDATNQDTNFLRNRIRHTLIPELKASYNPKIIDALNRMGSIIQKEEAWINGIVKQEIKNLVCLQKDRSILLSISPFMKKPLPLQRRITRNIIKEVKGNLHKITLSHIDTILHLIANASENSKIHLPDKLSVEITGDQAHFVIKERVARPPKTQERNNNSLEFNYNVAKPDAEPEKVIIQETGLQIQFSAIGINELPAKHKMKRNIAFLDMDQIHFPLWVRNFQPGDRFSPLGITGTQKIKNYFINNKIPQHQRKNCPILLSKTNIIWVVGHQIDDSVKITSLTRKILRAELLLA